MISSMSETIVHGKTYDFFTYILRVFKLINYLIKKFIYCFGEIFPHDNNLFIFISFVRVCFTYATSETHPKKI